MKCLSPPAGTTKFDYCATLAPVFLIKQCRSLLSSGIFIHNLNTDGRSFSSEGKLDTELYMYHSPGIFHMSNDVAVNIVCLCHIMLQAHYYYKLLFNSTTYFGFILYFLYLLRLTQED